MKYYDIEIQVVPDELSDEEKFLLRLFRSSDPRGRENILNIAFHESSHSTLLHFPSN